MGAQVGTGKSSSIAYWVTEFRCPSVVIQHSTRFPRLQFPALVYFIYLGEYCDGGRGCKWEMGATYNLIALLAYIFGAFFLGCMGSKPRERWEQDRPVRDIEEGPRNDPKRYRW